MRVPATSLSVIACLVVAGAAMAQSGGKPASGTPSIRACAVLTRDLAAKYGTQNPKLRAMFPPEEEAIGTHGSSCSDGGVLVQINPFLRHDDLRKSPGKEWQPISGVGDTAFFRNNRNSWAELMVWTAGHHFTIQLDVPDGASAESVKPNVTGLATALIARLKSMAKSSAADRRPHNYVHE